MAHIFLFGKASLDAFANTLLLNATINYILSRQIWRKSSLVLCIFLLYLNLLNFFFRYANVFFLWLYIYFHLVLRFAFIYFFIIIFFFTFAFCLYPGGSWIFKEPRDCNFLVYLFICIIFICVYQLFSIFNIWKLNIAQFSIQFNFFPNFVKLSIIRNCIDF